MLNIILRRNHKPFNMICYANYPLLHMLVECFKQQCFAKSTRTRCILFWTGPFVVYLIVIVCIDVSFTDC